MLAKSGYASIFLFFCCVFMGPVAHGKSPAVYNTTKIEIMPLAEQYLAEGKLAEAQNLLRTILCLEPYNAKAHFLLGKALLNGKKYEQACRELGQAAQCAPKDQIAAKANLLMEAVPPKFKQPRPRGCLARMSGECGQDGRENETLSAPLRQPATLLLFGAVWQNQFKSIEATANKLAAKAHLNVAIHTIELGEPETRQLFELFSITQLPAVVALNTHADFVGAITGQVSDNKLRALIAAASK